MTGTQNRIAILSDIHSNALALRAVITDINSLEPDVRRVWCLGDIVGRGCMPGESIKRMKFRYDQSSDVDKKGWLSGNHEYMVLQKTRPQFIKVGDKEVDINFGMNRDAWFMADNNNRQLQAEENGESMLEWLKSLPTYSEPLPGVYLVHAQFYYDEEEKKLNFDYSFKSYVTLEKQLREQFESVKKYFTNFPRIIMAGHTHMSTLQRYVEGSIYPVTNYKNQVCEFDLKQESVYINPGSVGFPRHPDDSPTYALVTFDDEKPDWVAVEIREVVYDWRPLLEKTENYPPYCNVGDYPQAFIDEIKRCRLPETS